MGNKVIKLNQTKDADDVLEQSKGVYQDVLIIGYSKDGDLYAHSNDSMNRLPEIVTLLEEFKLECLLGKYIEE